MIIYKIKAKEDKVKRYNVYEVNELNYGLAHMSKPDYYIEYTPKRFIGSTLAVSPEQAISRVAYREKRKVIEVIPWSCDGCRTSFLIAEEE